MRKFLTIVVASLVPIGMWTAGCRQDNRQAAFPKTAEMKGLAKADDKADSKRPPRIDPAPIDREVLNMPESPALARASAVKDRSEQIARPKPAEDLFSLHDNGGAVASASGYSPRPADIGPSPSGKEFWSRPVNAPMPRSSGPVPSDVSAMAPAAPEPSFAGPPVRFLPPASAQPKKKDPSAFMPIEDVPGIFLDGNPIGMRQNGSPPASRQSLNNAFPGGDALGAPPSLSRREFAKDPEKADAAARQGPLRLDLSGLVASRPSRRGAITEPAPAPVAAAVSPVSPTLFFPVDVVNPSITVRSIPGDYEPLPEPVPVATFMATQSAKPVFETATTTSAILDFIPPPTDRARPAAPIGVKTEDVRKALAPLPDLTAKPAESKGSPLMLKLPPTAAKETVKDDFWEKNVPSLEAMLDLELPEPKKKPPEKKTAIVVLPPELLKKQLLEPLPVFRDRTLEKIDDAVGVPPAPPIKE